MAKRKNPLKDIDSFLKQEASALIKPDKVEEQKNEAPDIKNLTKEDVLNYFEQLASKDENEFKTSLLEITKSSLENSGLSKAEDKMLMNTILYLQHPEDWKKVISAYWSSK